MRLRRLVLAIAVLALTASPTVVHATPEQDLTAFRSYFQQRFPDVPFDDYVNGIYALDPALRSQWQAIEEFAPYEISVEQGEELFKTPFANGRRYADCVDSDGAGIKKSFPRFDTKRGEVMTLEYMLNECRVANGEKPLKYKRGPLADISAYLAYQSRGSTIDVKVPEDGQAREWYERGKRHFYAKRGQLNMACADCHVYNAGNMVRSELLSPALGQVSHFPVYRSKWGSIGTLHRRYGGCNEQVRAKSFPPQSDEYRALEYFHTYMSNGLEFNGPGSRR